MSEAKIAQQAPFAAELEAGRKYFWCACGRSANQPFCDGSHKGTDIRPVPFEPGQSGTAYLCGCKRTGDSPYCDGTHNAL